jgi:hypothetical protein
MTQLCCEHEPLVAASVRSGISTAELDNHVATCAICAETKEVARLFLQHAAMTWVESQPLAAKGAWRKIQEQRRRFALKRATRGLALMRLFAAVYLVALAAWCLPTFWDMQSDELTTVFNALPGEMFSAGIAMAIVSVGLGAWCLLVMGRRVDFQTQHLIESRSTLSNT